MSLLTVEYCGEIWTATPTHELTIGRRARLSLDDNPHLHRRFLRVYFATGLWWIANTGDAMTATISDPEGLLTSTLAPMARMPVSSPELVVRFAAGPTGYELKMRSQPGLDQFHPPPSTTAEGDDESDTVGRITLSDRQRTMLVALAEHVLDKSGRAGLTLPTNEQAAQRLGWRRKQVESMLDHVSRKLEAEGVRGVRGGRGAAATQRRARLVDYAIAIGLITVDDLALLPPRTFRGELPIDSGRGGAR